MAAGNTFRSIHSLVRTLSFQLSSSAPPQTILILKAHIWTAGRPSYTSITPEAASPRHCQDRNAAGSLSNPMPQLSSHAILIGMPSNTTRSFGDFGEKFKLEPFNATLPTTTTTVNTAAGTCAGQHSHESRISDASIPPDSTSSDDGLSYLPLASCPPYSRMRLCDPLHRFPIITSDTALPVAQAHLRRPCKALGHKDRRGIHGLDDLIRGCVDSGNIGGQGGVEAVTNDVFSEHNHGELGGDDSGERKLRKRARALRKLEGQYHGHPVLNTLDHRDGDSSSADLDDASCRLQGRPSGPSTNSTPPQAYPTWEPLNSDNDTSNFGCGFFRLTLGRLRRRTHSKRSARASNFLPPGIRSARTETVLDYLFATYPVFIKGQRIEQVSSTWVGETTEEKVRRMIRDLKRGTLVIMDVDGVTEGVVEVLEGRLREMRRAW